MYWGYPLPLKPSIYAVTTVARLNNPYLVLQTDAGRRQLPLLGGAYWTFGRSDGNTVVLPDCWISRHHAMVQRMDGGEFYLIDLGSRNGTFVNGRRVSVPALLRDGDVITFGQTDLQFHAPSIDRANLRAVGAVLDTTATATLHVRRMISIVVVDIRDYTVLTRQMDETALSVAVGTWFKEAGDIIRHYGSWVDKYIGDAVMAVWVHGSENAQSADLLPVLQAVHQLATMTSTLYQRFKLPFPLRVGAGVNTGYAIVGNTGAIDRPDYTALGDTVNAAFRLESSTKQLALDLAMGETTFQTLAPASPHDRHFQRRTVTLKGYDGPLTAYGANFADLAQFLAAVAPSA